MSDPIVTDARIRHGRWEATVVLPDGAGDGIEILHEGRALAGVEVAPDPVAPGRSRLAVAIPAELLSDGVQTFLVRLAGAPDAFARFSIVTGVPVEDDLRAEIDLLRAELDLLKRAFRQHLVRQGG
ncbi:hypothetical protein [Frigidibacter sp. MR17.24]|uniref:hypothetical protein n=1 Tax=Frigidibacter sp. MR17.24 TaxID=3127345 RepID=UPI003012D485